jgi:ribose 5-phosphate isomerase B
MDKVAIGCDHAGYVYKEAVKKQVLKRGYEVMDFGTDSPDSVDYPDFVHPVAQAVESGEAIAGVVMCGSGNGVAMTANKHQGIRAAITWNTELAALARQHNDANIIAIPCRFVDESTAVSMVDIFLATDFEGGRHTRRVEKIRCT